jgi:hypothetical protein
MTLEDYNERLQGVIDDLQGGAHADLMVRLANDAIAMIRDRVQQRGETPQGGKYPPYSTREMLASDEQIYTSAKRKGLEWVTVKTMGGRNVSLAKLPGGYKQFREIHGRQTGYVDFTFTGRMMGNIALVSDRSELGEGVAVIRPKSNEEMRKLAGNEKRKGKILELSEQEKGDILGDYDKGILQIFRKNGL